jgi:pimeloyl-ACP methyl ester carboxylesterase
MARALGQEGYSVVGWSYPNVVLDVTAAADRLLEVVRLNLEFNRRVHFVTHSLGGIVVRRLLKLQPPERLGGIVILAPPNRGSAMARFILGRTRLGRLVRPLAELADGEHLEAICDTPARDVCVIAGTRNNDWKSPLTYIARDVLAGPSDGTVTVEETRLPRMERHLTVDASHTWIASHPGAIGHTLDFLDDVVERQEQGLRYEAPSQAADPPLQGQPRSLPNLELRVMDAGLFWRDLANAGGWRLQEHVLFGNCRILDPKSVRKAWGGKATMLEAFRQLSEAHGQVVRTNPTPLPS